MIVGIMGGDIRLSPLQLERAVRRAGLELESVGLAGDDTVALLLRQFRHNAGWTT